MKISNLPAFVFLLIFTCPALRAQTSLPDITTIIKNTNDRNEGTFLTQKMTIELINKKQKKKTQVARVYRKFFDNEKRQVFFYTGPASIRSTAFLSFNYNETDKANDSWLYLPALKKTRRISTSQKGDAFLGTDFSYEDINLGGKLSISDYSHELIGMEVIDGHNCYVIENIPVSEKLKKQLGYAGTKAWIDAELWIGRKVIFKDRQGKLFKTLQISDIVLSEEGFWTPQKLHMHNHKTGHQTIITFSETDYKTLVDDQLFSEEAMINGL